MESKDYSLSFRSVIHENLRGGFSTAAQCEPSSFYLDNHSNLPTGLPAIRFQPWTPCYQIPAFWVTSTFVRDKKWNSVLFPSLIPTSFSYQQWYNVKCLNIEPVSSQQTLPIHFLLHTFSSLLFYLKDNWNMLSLETCPFLQANWHSSPLYLHIIL